VVADDEPIGDLDDLEGERFHRSGTALWAAVHVDADVGGDPVQPGSQRRSLLERARGARCAQHRLLHGVFGFGTGAEHPVAGAGELATMCFERPVEAGRCCSRCHGHRHRLWFAVIAQ
jgi:hypothetical protein